MSMEHNEVRLQQGYFSHPPDFDSILRDVLRQWWVILLAAAAAALLAGAVLQATYVPRYRSSLTFAVSRSGVGSNVASESLTAANALAETFSTVVESDILKTRVCRQLGLEELDATISVSIVSSTNLMVVTVRAATPLLAYEVVQAVMDVATELCGELTKNVSISVLQAASIPTSAYNTQNVQRTMLYAGAGGGAAVLLLFALLSYLNGSAKSEADFRRKIDARLLATIPHEKKHKTAFRRSRRVYSLFMENPTLSFGYVEACHMMGTRVRREMDRRQAHVLMVSSVAENEGKSTVAANLAMAMVQEGRRVVLMDCDFRKPAQFKVLDLPRDKVERYDLGGALLSGKPVRATMMGMEHNLPVVFNTRSRRQLLNNETVQALRQLIRGTRERADYVIVDTSPMGLVAESMRIAQLADAVLLVVEQGEVDTRLVNDTIDRIRENGTDVLGCVFNNVHTGFFGRVTSYGSYSSYGYGRYGQGSYGKYGQYGSYDQSRKGKASEEDRGEEV